jgi:hypothetical protein
VSDWALYYADGSTYTSDDGPWSDAPSWGVQAVVVSYRDHPGVILTGDFYFIPAGASVPYAGDVWGVVDTLIVDGRVTVDDRLSDHAPAELVSWGIKFGRMLDREAYLELRARIVADARSRRNPAGTVRLDSRETGQPWEVSA